jgi:hypothetical protein
VNRAPETRASLNAKRPDSETGTSAEPRRICSKCGGVVEVIAITRNTTAGRRVPAKIGACVWCAQWFNEAGLGELNRYSQPAGAEGTPEGATARTHST